MPTYVSSQLAGLSVSGNTLVSAAVTAIAVGDTVIGVTNRGDTGLALSSVTDNAGASNTYNVATLNWSAFGQVCYFWAVNVKGGPTVWTLHYASAPSATGSNLFVEEYSASDSINVTAGPSEVDSPSPSLSVTTTAPDCTIWASIFNNDGAQPTTPSGFTLRDNHFSSSSYLAADMSTSAAGSTTVTWNSNGTLANQNQLMLITFFQHPLWGWEAELPPSPPLQFRAIGGSPT